MNHSLLPRMESKSGAPFGAHLPAGHKSGLSGARPCTDPPYDSLPGPGPRILMAMKETEDATARTRLASERTQLAWWRTGLTALAVALAIGRVVPELADSSSKWPYTTIGMGFAFYGIALIAYGTARARQLDVALSRPGGRVPAHGSVLSALTVAGIGLAIATAVLIVVA